MSYQDRIQEIAPKTKIECFGTAYYIAGVTAYPKSVDFFCAPIHFDKLELLDEPIIPCVLGIYAPTPKDQKLFGDEYLHHVAIVTELDPMKITHRNGNRVPLSENELFNLESVLANKGRVEYRRFAKE